MKRSGTYEKSKIGCPEFPKYVDNKSRLFCLKWVHVAQYGFILRQGRAMWLRIISGPLLTTKEYIKVKSGNIKIPKKFP